MSTCNFKKCAIPDCADRISPRHRFPINDKEIFNIWVKVVNHPRFQHLEDTQIYKSYCVCHRHFANDVWVGGTKRGLVRGAIPTLYLPNIDSESPECHNIKDLPLPKRIKLGDDLPGLSFSANEEVSIVLEGKSVQTRSHEGCLYPSVSSSESFSAQYVRLEEANEKNMDTVEAEEIVTKQKTLMSSKGTGNRRYILRNLNVKKQIQLTPKAKRIYKMVGEWSAKANSAARKLKSYESRLAEAERVASSPNFKPFKNLINNVNYKFIMRKIKNQKLPPRFSIEEKILATTLMKSSGKGYRLLSQIFILPSRQTITNLLLNILLQPSINSHVFRELKEAVSKTNQRDKYVS